MSNIHILEGRPAGDNKVIYRYAFHFLTGAEQAVKDKAVLDPLVSGFESEVPNIEQAELDAIRAGSVVEEVGYISYHTADDPVTYLDRLRAMWNERLVGAQGNFDNRYKYYGNSYVANP